VTDDGREIRQRILRRARQRSSPGRRGRGLLEILERLGRPGQRLVHVETLPARAARTAEPREPLPEFLAERLRHLGIEKLYLHQARALDLLRERRNVVVVTGTASGKTLCYNLPVLETLTEDPKARALYVFPTKALAQDQLKTLRQLGVGDPGMPLSAATYDGDTPGNLRRRVRDEARIILTNPDMLHAAILPNHARWAPVLSHLDTVVLDELHVYRGVFGAHVGNVLRRLLRILRHYGARPRFVATSATIANPLELATTLTGLPFELVQEDGSPRGWRHFVLWNPPAFSEDGLERRSANLEARDLLVELVREGYQTIAFVRARLVTEVLLRYCQDVLAKDGSGLAGRIRAYRGGYLPEERREIEAALFSGELLGVVSTNALELGIDVGSLDVALLVGYPGTIASTWQQAGRAGRREAESLAVLIAQNLPIDQYLMRHPDYFFAQSPEHAVADPGNPHVLLGHLRCAAYELPLGARDLELFGPYTRALARLLEEYGEVRRLKGRVYYAASNFPAKDINLRTTSPNSYTIVERRPDGPRTLGTMDEASAFSQIHPQAVYMHDAETYIVDELDLRERVAYVHRADVDYYTQAVTDTQILVNDVERRRSWRGGEVALGNVSVTDTVVLFKKIKFGSRDSIGYGPVELPPQVLHTTACWITPPASAIREVLRWGCTPAEGLLGLANVLGEVVGLFAMCDRRDVGTAVEAKSTGTQAVFVYDRYPGGLGFAMKTYDLLEEILEAARELVAECPCRGGCPSCVGSPIVPYARQDPDTQAKGKIPDKEATLILLHALLGREPYRPRDRRQPVPEEQLPEVAAAPEAAAEEPGLEAGGEGKALPKEVERKLREMLEELLSNPRPRRGGADARPGRPS
jgi:DEAD/DEAH box helicase domain-containing protein